jgi:hypothetical protein
MDIVAGIIYYDGINIQTQRLLVTWTANWPTVMIHYWSYSILEISF